MSHTIFHTNEGIHWDGTKWNRNYDIKHDLVPDHSPAGFGKSLTPEAAKKMIWEYLFEKFKDFFARIPKPGFPEFITFISKENHAIEFGKETLLRILTQEGCEGIRFSFCKNHDGETSVVAMGIEADKNDPKKAKLIKADVFNTIRRTTADDDPMLDEKGHGITIIEYILSAGISEKQLYEAATKPPERFDNPEMNKIINTIANAVFSYVK